MLLDPSFLDDVVEHVGWIKVFEMEFKHIGSNQGFDMGR